MKRAEKIPRRILYCPTCEQDTIAASHFHLGSRMITWICLWCQSELGTELW